MKQNNFGKQYISMVEDENMVIFWNEEFCTSMHAEMF